MDRVSARRVSVCCIVIGCLMLCVMWCGFRGAVVPMTGASAAASLSAHLSHAPRAAFTIFTDSESAESKSTAHPTTTASTAPKRTLTLRARLDAGAAPPPAPLQPQNQQMSAPHGNSNSSVPAPATDSYAVTKPHAPTTALSSSKKPSALLAPRPQPLAAKSLGGVAPTPAAAMKFAAPAGGAPSGFVIYQDKENQH